MVVTVFMTEDRQEDVHENVSRAVIEGGAVLCVELPSTAVYYYPLHAVRGWISAP